ncbi:exocyst complex subunit Sec15-like-domain-containing protein [Umbelopsis sp. AD052]|nr:exocyst complex subunit Sec15-like-domain-containing protein [Umbelopsis sp. AD052]
MSLQASIDSSSLTLTAGLDDAESIEQLGPIIKQISESQKQEAFIDQLDAFIRKKDGEIERMCNANYQEFVNSVDQLLKVRQGSLSLKRNIADLNKSLRATGNDLADKKMDLLEARKVQNNLEKAMDSIQDSLIVLELAESVRLKMENGKHYAALKILDRLQTQHLKNVAQYGFAKYLEESVPVMQNMIKESVTAQLKEWLYKLRGTSRKIGMLAMKYMQERQDRWRQRTAENPKLKSLQHHNVNSAIEMVVNEGNECIHVYNTIGTQNEFKNSYEEDRRAQANLALNMPINLRDGNMDSFETLLQDIVGFFIIEHVIMHSTTDFRSQAEVDALWEMVTTKVIAVISHSLHGCRDPELFLQIKYSLLIFNQTLEGFNYPVKNLQETLLTLFQRYSELLINQYSENFEKIVQEDECMPMTVNIQEELDEVMQYTRYQPDRDILKQYGFPFTLPFSKVFPTCCRDVSIFVHQFYQFAEGFSQTHGEMDEILKKAVDSLLITKVNAILLKKLESTNLSQIVQIIINIEYFESTCPDFEMLLMETRSFHRAGPIQLRATSTFKETRQTAEKRIFKVVNLKLDEFLELSEYDW